MKKKSPSIQEIVAGIFAGNRALLAQAITLMESNAPSHRKQAREVLQQILPQTGNSIRLGITGVPGAGKSTLINALGTFLCRQKLKIAVLAIDPSSSVTMGSILGDKTRMAELSRKKNCFIRPSPTGGRLGGVTYKTRETILLCEAAGYEIIFVETVGVGQSELLIRSMVDVVLLLTLTGAGDELQNIKKGIIEVADIVLMHKADGDNKRAAERTAHEIKKTLRCFSGGRDSRIPVVLTCSALKEKSIQALWQSIEQLRKQLGTTGEFKTNRRNQLIKWLDDDILEKLRTSFFENERIADSLARCRSDVLKEKMTVSAASEFLFELYKNHDQKD